MELTKKLGIFCVVVVAIVALIAQIQPAHADKVKPADDVNVVNTPTVNVGTPTVKATQSGPWSVGLSGPVTVGDVAPTQPYQASCDSSLNFSDNINECFITVPAGKRLIVQTLSIHADADPGVRVSQAAVTTFDSSGVPTILWMNMPFTGTFPCACGDVSQVTQDVHLYVDGGSNLIFELLYNTDTARNNLRATVIGYLVNMT